MFLFKKILAFLILISLLPAFVFAQDLNSVDQQIQQSQDALNKTQAQSQTLEGQINSFNQSIGNLQGEINNTQGEINDKEKNIISLSSQIELKEKEIADSKQTLNESLKFLYETGDTPILELILSSKSISSALDQMEYISWVGKQVKDTMDKIVADKKAIEAAKQQQEDAKASLVQLEQKQNAELAGVSEQRNAKNELLAYTQNNEQIYQQKLGSLQEQRAYLLTLYDIQLITGGAGGYPYANYSMDADTALGPARECTSYVAWKRASVGNSLTFSWHDAGTWADGAIAAGYHTVDNNPKPGDVMVIPWNIVGGVGHVAYVESVNNGIPFISQYNYYTDNCETPGNPACKGNYSEMNAPASWTAGSLYIH